MFNGGAFGSFVSPADLAEALAALPATTAPLPAASVAALGTSARLAKEDHRHRGRYTLYQFNVPMILLSSGTVNASGLFTGLTAQQSTLPATLQTYVYVAAGIGLAAGWYLATWASTTSCQLVGSPATTAGAYAGITPNTPIVLPAAVTLPANSLGLTGTLRFRYRMYNNNSAGGKALTAMIGGSAWTGATYTTGTSSGTETSLRNMNSVTIQEKAGYSGDFGGSPPGYQAFNTAADLALTFSLNLINSAADTVMLTAIDIDVLPSIT